MGSKLAGMRVLVASLFSIGGITFLCFRLIPASSTTVALLLLLVVLTTAVTTRLGFAMFAAFVATICLDVFFLPPIGRASIADPQNWVALLVFWMICLVAGNLSHQLRTQRDCVVLQQREAERLHSLSRTLLMSTPEDDMRRLIVNGCTQLFELEEFALYESASGNIHRSRTNHPFPEEAMRTATATRQIAIEAALWMVVPVSLGNLSFGCMAYSRRSGLPQGTIDSLASTIALGLAQVQAQEAASRAHAVRRSEELKSVMIDALAHDLKTPLTSIEAAADMLGGPRPLSAAQERDMIAVIQEETRGLRRLVDEATHLARIDAKRLKLELKPGPVRQLIQTAIQSLGERAASRMETQLSSSVDDVLIDAELMTQALKQLIDNALKYGPPRSAVIVLASQTDGVITIGVRDSGPGLTELEQSKVFDKFYRGRYDHSAIQGTGMGLSIAREIVEAHGGSVGVRSYAGQGTEFFISLKAVAVAAAAERELTA